MLQDIIFMDVNVFFCIKFLGGIHNSYELY